MTHDEQQELEALSKDDQQYRLYTLLRLRSGEERFDRLEGRLGGIETMMVKYNKAILGAIAFLAVLYFTHIGGGQINVGDILCKLALRVIGLG